MKPRTNIDYISIGIVTLCLFFYAYKIRLNNKETSDFIIIAAIVVTLFWSYGFYKGRTRKPE